MPNKTRKRSTAARRAGHRSPPAPRAASTEYNTSAASAPHPKEGARRGATSEGRRLGTARATGRAGRVPVGWSMLSAPIFLAVSQGLHECQAEGAAAEAFVTAASSLTESAFAPTLATATEWAKARASDPEAARARLSALFRVASALADALRGVFTPLAAPILDLAAAALDPEADGSLGSLGARA